MRVLVTAGTKHGATAEIAAAIGRGLEADGIVVDVRAPDDLESVDAYDAVVLGSAVYVGHWVEAAQRFVERHEDALVEKPVWIFSSGPIGDPPKPAGDAAVDVSGVVEAIEPRDHKVLSGKVDKSTLGFGERAVLTAVRAKEGDYRDWPAIDAWAREIAAALRESAAVS
jgi:menaquinone-dependent protoporphyrinogen oxidase